MKAVKDKKVLVLFKWVSCKADTAEFRQDSDLLLLVEPCPEVGVVVPFEPVYFLNYEDVSTEQLTGGNAPILMLTPTGMAYAKRELEKAFKPTAKEESWEETTKKETKLNGTSSWEDNSGVDWASPKVEANISSKKDESVKEDWGTSPWSSGTPEEKFDGEWKE